MTEFNLSEKEKIWAGEYLFSVDDVKEFIRLLKEDLFIKGEVNEGSVINAFLERLDKLAGDKLTK